MRTSLPSPSVRFKMESLLGEGVGKSQACEGKADFKAVMRKAQRHLLGLHRQDRAGASEHSFSGLFLKI